MDEDDFVRTGMEIVLAPVTGIAADVLGLAGGDWLHEQRERARASLQEKTRKILRERNVTPQEASPTILLPLLSAAQDETREELLDLWAKLLAAALDPARANSVRREFIQVVKQMEPLDAFVLENWPQRDKERLIAGHSRNSDKVLVSLEHLHRLSCVDTDGHPRPVSYVPHLGTGYATCLTPFARELLGVLRDRP